MSDPRAKAIPYLRERADAGDPEAQFKLGECYRDGIGIQQDLTEAKRLFQTAANSGHPEATNALAHLQPPAPPSSISSPVVSESPQTKQSGSSSKDTERGCGCAVAAVILVVIIGANSFTKTTGFLLWQETHTDWDRLVPIVIFWGVVAFFVGKNWK